MKDVEIYRIKAGTWQALSQSWEQVLQSEDALEAQAIFTSAITIAKAPHLLRARICKKFGIAPILFNRMCLDSNGFSGCETVYDKDQNLACYNYWSHFVVKQTYEELRPRNSFFTRHRTTNVIGNIQDLDKPIHGPHTIHGGWEWYEMGFHVHWKATCATTLLCFDLPKHMKVSLQSTLASNIEKLNFSNPYFMFSLVIYELLSLYDDSIWSLRNHICSVEATRPQDPDYPLLHEIARHAIHVTETIAVALESIRDLQLQHRDFSTKHSSNSDCWSHVHNQFQFQIRFLHGSLMRSESHKARIENEITLAYNTAAQRDSSTQVRIGEEAIKETTAMKAIALVTMTFLPATFVASIFSMSFFHFEPAKGGMKEAFTLSDKFWMYWVVAAPLSVTTLAVWMLWERRLSTRS